jgi:hypothetical protein
MRELRDIMNDLHMMQQAKKIREWLAEISGVIPRLKDRPNPYYGNTMDGLCLIGYYGGPSCIGTPFGSWPCGGGGSHNATWFEEATERLGLVEVMPGTNAPNGYYGPVWGITKDVDGNPVTQFDWQLASICMVGIVSHTPFSHKRFASVNDALEFAKGIDADDILHPGFNYPEKYTEAARLYAIGRAIQSKIFEDMKPKLGFIEWDDKN